MFLDPFTFTPPRPDVLTRAVESYQRVAAARFCGYARIAEDPDWLPRKLSGDSLEPTPKQLHAEVRALRHLTAIQRTLREIGGPAFDPDSPIPPHERFRLVDRRLDAIEEALGGDDDSFTDDPPGTPSASSASSSSDFPSSESADKPDFYHPPEIEDLLAAVDFAQTVFAARAELLDKRRLQLSSEDFLLEITALRDLTAVVRTLRRMSAQPLPERQTHEDLQNELSSEPAHTLSHEPPPAEATHRSHPSYRSHGFSKSEESVKSASHGEAAGRSRVDASSSSDPSGSRAGSSAEALAKEEASGEGGPASSDPPRSHAEADADLNDSPRGSSESEKSVKSASHGEAAGRSRVDASSSSDPSGARAGSSAEALAKEEASREGGPANLVNSVGVASPRPVPRVPEVRTITPRNGATPAPEPEVARNFPTSLQDRHGVSSRRSPSAKPEAGNEAGQDRTHPPHSSEPAPDSKIPNRKSEIANPKSKIPNPSPPYALPVLHDKDPP